MRVTQEHFKMKKGKVHAKIPRQENMFQPQASSVTICNGHDANPSKSSSEAPFDSSTSCYCLQGYYGPRGGTCTACPRGTAKSSDDSNSLSGSTSTDCTTCPAGKFSSGYREGTRNTAKAATSCTDCPNFDAGGISSIQGSDDFQDCFCLAGHYGARGVQCTNCRGGTYKISDDRLSSTGSSSDDCVECARGKFSTFPEATSDTVCTNCIAGKYAPNTGRTDCLQCTGEQFAEFEGMSECKTCPRGKFILDKKIDLSNAEQTVSGFVDYVESLGGSASGIYNDWTGYFKWGVGWSNVNVAWIRIPLDPNYNTVVVRFSNGCNDYAGCNDYGVQLFQYFADGTFSASLAKALQFETKYVTVRYSSGDMIHIQEQLAIIAGDILLDYSRVTCHFCEDGKFSTGPGKTSCNECARGSFSERVDFDDGVDKGESPPNPVIKGEQRHNALHRRYTLTSAKNSIKIKLDRNLFYKDPEVTQYTASAHVIEAGATVSVKKFCFRQSQTDKSGPRDEDPLKGVAEAGLWFRASWKDFDANDKILRNTVSGEDVHGYVTQGSVSKNSQTGETNGATFDLDYLKGETTATLVLKDENGNEVYVPSASGSTVCSITRYGKTTDRGEILGCRNKDWFLGHSGGKSGMVSSNGKFLQDDSGDHDWVVACSRSSNGANTNTYSVIMNGIRLAHNGETGSNDCVLGINTKSGKKVPGNCTGCMCGVKH